MEEIYKRYPKLLECSGDMEAAYSLMEKTYKRGGKVLLCGNGGSAADCEHITGELMKGFLLRRQVGDELAEKLSVLGYDDAGYICENLQGALPAIPLTSQSALISAYANDVAPELVYAQLVYGYARSGDLLICISTSGNSKNAVYAAKVATALGVDTLALTGKEKSSLSEICTVTVRVPESETFKVQELHLPVYHWLCMKIEAAFFRK